MIDFFISHNKAEKGWARQLTAALRKRNVTYFFDEEAIQLGDDVVAAIGSGLKTSSHVVFVMSPDSVKSRWVELEWASSLYEDIDASARKLIPVLVQTCEIPYVLKRLNYLDARELDVDAVAEKLALLIRPVASSDPKASSANSQQRAAHQFSLPARMPLGYSLKGYVERDADRRLRQLLSQGFSAIVYGPRKIGKTSLLQKISGDATLMGWTPFFVDLHGEVDNDIWWYVAHRLSDTFAKSLSPKERSVPIGITVRRIIDYICADRSLLLLFDEADLLVSDRGGHPQDPAIAGLLRSLVNDPRLRGRLAVVCAGWQPHRHSTEDLVSSPWWNLFELIRLRAFSVMELQRLASEVGLELTPDDVSAAHDLTAGDPWTTGCLLNLLVSGKTLAEIRKDPLHELGHLTVNTLNTYDLLKRKLGTNFSLTLKALLGHERIPSRQLREILWLLGVTRDIDEDPPVCSELFYCVARTDVDGRE
jgi:hypothetical protein